VIVSADRGTPRTHGTLPNPEYPNWEKRNASIH
jgi:hypothetical protein